MKTEDKWKDLRKVIQTEVSRTKKAIYTVTTAMEKTTKKSKINVAVIKNKQDLNKEIWKLPKSTPLQKQEVQKYYALHLFSGVFNIFDQQCL